MKATKLPKMDSIQELAKFWDTHDLTEFRGELKEVAEPVFAADDSIHLSIASERGQGRAPPRRSQGRFAGGACS